MTRATFFKSLLAGLLGAPVVVKAICETKPPLKIGAIDTALHSQSLTRLRALRAAADKINALNEDVYRKLDDKMDKWAAEVIPNYIPLEWRSDPKFSHIQLAKGNK